VTVFQPPAETREQPDHPGYELAFQEGLRGISQQQAVLDGLQRRAGTLLAVASIVTSFLGGLALDGAALTRLGWLAIFLFIVAAGLITYVLLPRGDYYFRSQPTAIIRGYVEDHPSAPLWAMHKQLAEHLESDLIANEKRMKPLFRVFQWANVALAGEVAVWLVLLMGR
jgi:hypothetical protein